MMVMVDLSPTPAIVTVLMLRVLSETIKPSDYSVLLPHWTNRQGNFVDSLPMIWRRYVSVPTLFWLDAVTSIPVSFLELSLSQVSVGVRFISRTVT